MTVQTMKAGPYSQVEADRAEQATAIVTGDMLCSSGDPVILENEIWEFQKLTGCDAVTVELVPGDDIIRLSVGKPTVWFRLEKAFQQMDLKTKSSGTMLNVVDRFLEDRANLLEVLAAIPETQWECEASGPSLLLFATIYVLERYDIIEEGPQGLETFAEIV